MDATLDMFDKKRREFHLDRYRFAAARVEQQKVLDCACGTGYGCECSASRATRRKLSVSIIAPASVDLRNVDTRCGIGGLSMRFRGSLAAGRRQR
jgi:ubiquinone/menaquinone biosynthesis C-methylase UbiE